MVIRIMRRGNLCVIKIYYLHVIVNYLFLQSLSLFLYMLSHYLLTKYLCFFRYLAGAYKKYTEKGQIYIK